MFKKYFITVGSRYITALLNFVVVLLCSRNLGAEGLGFISMFILCIAINTQISSFFGGSALVYLTPKENLATLLIIAYFGTVGVHALLLPIYLSIKPFDINYFPGFFFISILSSLFSVNQSIMLGKEKIESYNILSLFQILLLTLILGFLVLKLKLLTINYYIIALGISYFMAFAGSSGVVLKDIPQKPGRNSLSTLGNVLKFGFFSETANIMQLLGYRLNYLFINKWLGLAALGEFSLAVQLTEGLRIFSKGIATVEYSQFSNTESMKRKVVITKKSIQVSLLFTIIGLLVLILIPLSWIQFIFGNQFHQTKLLIALLSPGILFLSAGTIISPFFSGQGKHYINTIASSLCFAVTALSGLLLIPFMGLPAASIVNSLAYIALFLFLYFTYRKHLEIR